MRRRGILLLSILTLAGAVAVSGCSQESRRRALTVFFEGVPKPGEAAAPRLVVRKPRREPPIPPAAPEIVEAALPPPPEPETPFGEWRDVIRRFPKDVAGGVDWARALEEGLIAPRPGLTPETKSQPVFDLNVERVPETQPFFEVVFPHKAHTEWLACANCHPAIFQMRRGAAPITMAKIYAGEFCGRCHGTVAFAVPTGCPRCHVNLAPPKAEGAPSLRGAARGAARERAAARADASPVSPRPAAESGAEPAAAPRG